MRGEHARPAATGPDGKPRWYHRKKVWAFLFAGTVPVAYLGFVLTATPYLEHHDERPFDPKKPFVVSVRHFYPDITFEALAVPLPPGADRVAFLAGSYGASRDGLRRFAEMHLGAQVGPETFTLTFQASGKYAVQIIDITVVDVHKAAPLSGALFVPYTQGGGPDAALTVSLDISAKQPRLLDAGGQPVAESHSLPLRVDNPLALNVTVTSPGASATWLFEVTFVGPGGKQGVARFDGGGDLVGAAPRAMAVPFAITDRVKRYAVGYSATPANTFTEAPYVP